MRLLLRRAPAEIIRGVREQGLAGVGAGLSRTMGERPSNPLEQYAEKNMSWVEGLGLLSDVLRASHASDPKRAMESVLLGPTVADMLRLAGNASQSLRDVKQAAQNRVQETEKQVSFVGPRSLMRQAIGLTVTPGLTTVGGVPGAVVGKAIENLDLFRSPAGLRRELARKIAAALVQGNREDAMRLQAEYLKAYGRYYEFPRRK